MQRHVQDCAELLIITNNDDGLTPMVAAKSRPTKHCSSNPPTALGSAPGGAHAVVISSTSTSPFIVGWRSQRKLCLPG